MDLADMALDSGPNLVETDDYDLDVGAPMDTEMDGFDFQLDGAGIDDETIAAFNGVVEDPDHNLFNNINHKSFLDNLHQHGHLNASPSGDPATLPLGDLGDRLANAIQHSDEPESSGGAADQLDVRTTEEAEIGYDDDDGGDGEAPESEGNRLASAMAPTKALDQQDVAPVRPLNQDEISYDDDIPPMHPGAARGDHERLDSAVEPDHAAVGVAENEPPFAADHQPDINTIEGHNQAGVAQENVGGLATQPSQAGDVNTLDGFDFGELIEGKDVNDAAFQDADDHHSLSLDQERDAASQDNASSPDKPEIYVVYGDDRYALVGAATDDEGSFFFPDETLLNAPLSDFLSSLRDVIVDDISPNDEVRVEIEQMSLEFGEWSNKQFLSRTFREILDCFDVLAAQQEQKPDSLVLRLCVIRDSEDRFAELLAEASGQEVEQESRYSSQYQSPEQQNEAREAQDTEEHDQELSPEAEEQRLELQAHDWSESAAHDNLPNGVDLNAVEQHAELAAETAETAETRESYDEGYASLQADTGGLATAGSPLVEARDEADAVHEGQNEDGFSAPEHGHDLKDVGYEHLDMLENPTDDGVDHGPSANQPSAAASDPRTTEQALLDDDRDHSLNPVPVDMGRAGDVGVEDQIDTADGRNDPLYVLEADNEDQAAEDLGSHEPAVELIRPENLAAVTAENGPTLEDTASSGPVSDNLVTKVKLSSSEATAANGAPSNYGSEATGGADEIDYEDHEAADSVPLPLPDEGNPKQDDNEDQGFDSLGNDNVEIDWGNDDETAASATFDETVSTTPTSASGKRARQTDDPENHADENDNKRRRT